MTTRQTVLNVMKDKFGEKVSEIRDCNISLVMIFLGVEGEPNKRLAPLRARVTALEAVGD